MAGSSRRSRRRMCVLLLPMLVGSCCPETADVEAPSYGYEPYDDGDGDPCRSQCELQAGTCEERDISEFGDFEATRQEWLDLCWGTLDAGTCSDGKAFLHGRWGYEVDHIFYFDLDSGAFMGLETSTDSHIGECGFYGYWPHPWECPDAVITEAMCLSDRQPGDPAPWISSFGDD